MGKHLTVILLLFLGVQLLANAEGFVVHPDDLSDETRLWSLYLRWLHSFNVSRTEDEMRKRFHVFVENVRFIEEFNKKGSSFELQLNAFGDLTNKEFLLLYAGFKPDPNATNNVTEVFEHGTDQFVPKSVDWRARGAVTRVKDQLKCVPAVCGTTFRYNPVVRVTINYFARRILQAFAVVAAIEGLNMIKTGRLVSLSEQELVDCNAYAKGCKGGDRRMAIYFASRIGGLTAETNYPYRGYQSTCQTNKLKDIAAKVRGLGLVSQNNEYALMQATARQPITVSVDATTWQFYHKGVFKGPWGLGLNHGVTIVGYGTTVEGTKYWLVKNSWGTGWGENGYIRMLLDVSKPAGLCGIAMIPAFPV